MRRIFALAVACAGLAALSTHADATDPGRKGQILPDIPGVTVAPGGWTGVYVGVGGGWQVADTEISVPGFSIIDGISGRGWTLDGRIGADWQPKGTPLVFGVFGGYNFGEAEFGAFNDTITASIEPQGYLGARLGLALPTKSLLYGAAAWQRAEGRISVGGKTIGSQTSDGTLWLLGIEQMLAPNMALAFEYAWAEHGFEVGSVSIDPDVHAFKLRLNLRTN